MREREIELIAALAEGALEDETEARALLESSAEARAEYEAQLAAIEALTSVEPADLTDQERAVLHRDLWTELSSDRQPTGRQAIPWYLRLSYVAAGLFVVVGLVAVLSQGGEDAADLGGEATAELQAEGAPDTTVAPDSALGRDEAGGDDGSADMADTTESMAEEGAADAMEAPAVDPDELSRLADLARSGTLDETEANAALPADADPDTAECIARAGLEEHAVISVVDVDGTYLLAVPAAEPLEEGTTVVFVGTATCEIVYIDE